MAISKPHLLLIPYPLQGHIIPAVHLSLKLAAAGFSITFVNTEAVHHRLLTNGAAHGDIFTGARADGFDIRYKLVSDGLPVSFDRSLYHDEFMEKLLHGLHRNVEALARRLPALTGLIADTFFVWPATLARSLGIPYVSFWTEPALVFSLYYHMDLLRENGHFGSDDNRKDTITYLPGVTAIEPVDLMSYLRDTDTSAVVHQIIYKAFDEAHRADFVLCNTVQELEPNTISAIQKKKPFYAVGPIFPTDVTSTTVVPTSLWTESDCSQWLNARPAGSVLYISFGSYAHVERKELEEIAHGVALSRVSFLWVLRPDVVSSEDSDPLPVGFREETAGRGMVVQWCCQTEVLGNSAVGGFLTHCGWNSVLESVWNGVPMICYPLLTDQFTNRKLVVGDWKVGEGFNGGRGVVRREEVGKKIEGLMKGKERERMREELKKVRGVLRAAVAAGGSSGRNFKRFVEDLKGWGRKV
ncbi:hypothetical protein M5K25_001332 [Dendrobium thyrsiflorum]|uniref:Glycosyltransferase n=1 Tax=Dendrobium thyrsiflorum TaxID=117978 RepID=A0ABD0VQ85_DENTH